MKKGVLCLTKTLGDVVVGNVLAKNIKLQNDSIELDYIVEDKYMDLIKYSPHISKVIPIKNTLQEWDNILSMFLSYDVVFCPQQTTPEDNVWHQKEKYRYNHLVDFYAERCNIKLLDRKLCIYSNDVSKKAIKNDIAIHTKTLAGVKDWGRFKELCDVLYQDGYTITQLGQSLSEKVVNDIDFVMWSLKDVIDYFLRGSCKIFIGLDSGLSYVAASAGVNVIQIMGATVPETSGAYGDNVHVILSKQNEDCSMIRKGIRCHGINKGICNYGEKCINNISVNDVVKKVKEIING